MIQTDNSDVTDFSRRLSEKLRPLINGAIDTARRTREKIVSILSVPNNNYQLKGIDSEKIGLIKYCTDTIDAANTLHKNISLFQVQEISPENDLDFYVYAAAVALLTYSLKDIFEREDRIISLDTHSNYDWEYFV